ncbi:MAG: hypothetical protein ABIY52_04485 [Gemmatimonadaceae bacterium]
MTMSQRTLQEYRTTLSPAEVIAAAKGFFSKRASLYAAFLEQESAQHVSFRGQGGEELVIGVVERDGVTAVNGSSYMFDMQVARFFTTLPQAETTGAVTA